MAEKLLENFMREMGDLGFAKTDILSQIEDYEEEDEK